jgi:hypothetical protein
MKLICSVTPLIYYGVFKYERKYRKSNKITNEIKEASKSSIMLGKLAIDFLAHYRHTVDGKYEGLQEQFYDPGDPNWVEIMNEYKEEWVDDIPLKDYKDTNIFKDSNIFKEKNLFDLCMNIRKLSDIQLESIEEEDEKIYWRMNVERFIDEAIHMAYRLTMKMNKYIKKYGELKITGVSYDWSVEGQKWLDGIAESKCKEEGI